MKMEFGPRRAVYLDISREMNNAANPLSSKEVEHYEMFDLIYRSTCSILYNYVPTSGHPGGSISSGRFVSGILFNTASYDMSDPDRKESDQISYAAGHKAMGLYAMWALRNEIARAGAPQILPASEGDQLRLEDLLGFRRNPVNSTPLFLKFKSKALDGHPTPITPFIKLSTGASGVGVASSMGLAFAALDYYGDDSPYVHIVEGEGGLTPGRASEALAAAGTSSLRNAILHLDWNQASIDSDQVCRDGETPGDYVQWNPLEFAYLHDWNVIKVPDGTDFQQILLAQEMALKMENSQPTAIVYRTTKGWQYGITGKKSHGAGHAFCSDGFYETLEPLIEATGKKFPRFTAEDCKDNDAVEKCFWDSLLYIRRAIEEKRPMVDFLAKKLSDSRERLGRKKRKPRSDAPSVETVFAMAKSADGNIPAELVLTTGKSTTLRGELGRVLNYYNIASKGSLLAASADLLGSTSVNVVAKGFPEGFYNSKTNPGARILSTGGICEDGTAGIMSGVSAYGEHIGVCSSYAAFIAVLGHISCRLHAIGNQAKYTASKRPYRPFFLINAHVGIKTGEDGPTHADPQPLQTLQENFARGTLITLTPWDPQEIWYLVTAALARRPAVICPFVTRPNEVVIDREALGLAPASASVSGVYPLLRASSKSRGTVVLQGSEVAYEFIRHVLPALKKENIDINVFYISSVELFDALPKNEQAKIFPEALANEAMGITGFTLPTMYRWVRSEKGRDMSLYPLKQGFYLGSGKAEKVIEEAGLDGESQLRAILAYVRNR